MKYHFYGVLFGLLALSMSARVLLAGPVFATGTNPANSIDFGEALQMYNQAFKNIMPCGYPPYNLPVLAPFSIDFWPFNFTNEYYSVIGNVSNTVITGLNNYQLLGGTYNESTQSTTYDLIFNDIQILGEYEVDASAILAGYPVKVVGQGLINTNFVDLRLVGSFTLAPSIYNPNGLRISNFNLNFYLADIAVNNWNKLWDISFNNFVNRWNRDFALMYAQQIQSQVNELYAQLVLPRVNGALEDVDMNQLVDFFVITAQKWNMASCNLA